LNDEYMIALDRMADADRDDIHFAPRVLDEAILGREVWRQHVRIANGGYYLMFEI
tara:strand:- start:455 stop:619 length:165 start_codon:yes stop_codon:yes gene_type:complete